MVIEQAKGVLCERLGLPVDLAFDLLRYAARSSRRPLKELCREVVETRTNPTAIVIALARAQRWRAANQKERSELHRERARQVERARDNHEQMNGLEALPEPPSASAGFEI